VCLNIQPNSVRVWFVTEKCLFFLQRDSNIYISSRSVLYVEDIGVLGENHRPVARHWQTLSHHVFSGTPRHERVRTRNLSSDCTGSCKFNYYAITTTTAPFIMIITKLPNTEKSSKGKGKTHKSTNRQNQSTTGKLEKPQWP